MPLLRKIVPLTILVTVCFIASGQQSSKHAALSEYRSVNWNSEDGLIYGRVNCIIKDKNGFLWIGTEKALNRFDGNIFKTYLNAEHQNQKVAGNFISSLVEDSLHNIWVGTDKGASRYDIRADTFKNFLASSSGSASTFVIPFWATKNELLCVESDSLVTAYNIYSLAKRVIVKLSEKIKNNAAVSLSIYDAGDNCVWMLPLDGEGGLIRVSLQSGSQTRYNWKDDENRPKRSHNSEGMRYDRRRNCIWTNSVDGLIQFTLADKQFHYTNGLSDIYNKGVGIGIDTRNRVWVGTGDKGVFIYNPDTKTVDRPFVGDSTLQHQVNDMNYRIYCDLDGITWMGYWVSAGKGLTELIPYSKVVQRYPGNTGKPNSFKSAYGYIIEKANNGQMWIFEDDPYIVDPNTGLFIVIHTKNLPGIHGNTSMTLLGMSETASKAWLSGNQTYEFFEMDIKSKQCHVIPVKDTANHLVAHLAADPIGPYKNGIIFLDRIDENKKRLFIFNPDSSAARQVPGLASENITDAVTDGDKFLFLRRPRVSTNLSYALKKGRFTRIPTPLDTVAWNCIFFNNNDRSWWVGAFMQLIHYNEHFRFIRRYTTKDGLPSINVLAIQADNENNIWLHTERSVARLNPATNIISTLSQNEGLQQQPYHGTTPFAKDNGGDMYLFGFDGIDRIKPYNFKSNYPPSSVYLKSLEINQKEVSLGGVNQLRELSLKYFQNQISIETGIIDYYSKGTSIIRYKLRQDGKDENWQYRPANYTMRFEALQPGKYLLRMQASNAALQFNGPENTLSILVSPPWYGTWWFRVIIIAITSVIIIGIFRARIKKIRDDARIENQLKELEMKALKAQMNPHFIYNALNSIQALVANDKKADGIRYIGSFSRLLRQVLDNSENNVISLDKELETVDLYIQLESLRLDMQLHYKKIVPENVVTEFEKIPPLILQPFVENALWHGLSRKEGKKEIAITVGLTNEWLYCDITDNGIGRERAKELTNNSAVIHQSKGIDITRKRLMDFNQDDLITPVDFVDLYDDNQAPAGTRVIVKIKRKAIMC